MSQENEDGQLSKQEQDKLKDYAMVVGIACLIVMLIYLGLYHPSYIGITGPPTTTTEANITTTTLMDFVCHIEKVEDSYYEAECNGNNTSYSFAGNSNGDIAGKIIKYVNGTARFENM
jgi:hypothetical protein